VPVSPASSPANADAPSSWRTCGVLAVLGDRRSAGARCCRRCRGLPHATLGAARTAGATGQQPPVPVQAPPPALAAATNCLRHPTSRPHRGCGKTSPRRPRRRPWRHRGKDAATADEKPRHPRSEDREVRARESAAENRGTGTRASSRSRPSEKPLAPLAVAAVHDTADHPRSARCARTATPPVAASRRCAGDHADGRAPVTASGIARDVAAHVGDTWNTGCASKWATVQPRTYTHRVTAVSAREVAQTIAWTRTRMSPPPASRSRPTRVLSSGAARASTCSSSIPSSRRSVDCRMLRRPSRCPAMPARNPLQADWYGQGRIRGYESVTVPAGTFKSLKVEIDSNRRPTEGIRSREPRYGQSSRFGTRPSQNGSSRCLRVVLTRKALHLGRGHVRARPIPLAVSAAASVQQ
jgi:hypothetical protein